VRVIFIRDIDSDGTRDSLQIRSGQGWSK